ncbi:MAG: DUF4145 domain-containing protein [Sulfurovum sp.]|nr:DUF4145 domain-containing protein [Sulfurovum sp.]
MNKFFDPTRANWRTLQKIASYSYDCGYCNRHVSSNVGYKLGELSDGGGIVLGGLYICPNCQGPTFLSPKHKQYPSPSLGNPVNHVPGNLTALYNEARRCSSQSCYTGAVLLCRKMLMNIAVEQGAKEGLSFLKYVAYLSEQGFIPPNGKHWVDHIRKKGNEATHEISIMEEIDARELLAFTEMLLKFIYEFPNMVTV